MKYTVFCLNSLKDIQANEKKNIFIWIGLVYYHLHDYRGLFSIMLLICKNAVFIDLPCNQIFIGWIHKFLTPSLYQN